MLDLATHHGTNSAEFTVRQLSGKGLAGGKGKIELLLGKKGIGQSIPLPCCEHALQ